MIVPALEDEQAFNELVRKRYLNEWILKTYTDAIDGIEDIAATDSIRKEEIDREWSSNLKLTR